MMKLRIFLPIAAAFSFLLGIWLSEYSLPTTPPPDNEPPQPALNLSQVRLPAPGAMQHTPAAAVRPSAASNTEATGISIQIQWPAELRERRQVRHVLHQCLGVRLAKVDVTGQILAIEVPAPQQSFSQYARQFTLPMEEKDAHQVAAWRATPGTLVRLYPDTLDQALFRAFRLDKSHRQIDITGQFRWRANSLIMHQVTINGALQPGLLKLQQGNC